VSGHNRVGLEFDTGTRIATPSCRGKNTGEEGEERDFVKSQQTMPFHLFFLISFFNLTRVFW
jgi:hypothetical protein